MAGHSKWANIQHRKGRQDARRGKLFSRLIREVTHAARKGADPSGNPRLRAAMDTAAAANIPKDTIERARVRGAGGDEGQNLEEIRYEGYAPGGVAVIVDCLSDNRTRTVGEVRHAFTKHGGNLGTDGSVAFLFRKVGQISYAAGVNEDKVMEAALEAGADDIVTNEDGSIDVLTAADDFMDVKDRLVKAGFEAEVAEITMRPSTSVTLNADHATSIIELTRTLEDLDDVQKVYSNADIPDDVLAKLG
ncbi:MAG TPA: YebC/PmpR family DNA-binding transcriptional regulator [Gammaproteobacteria bacterium]